MKRKKIFDNRKRKNYNHNSNQNNDDEANEKNICKYHQLEQLNKAE